MKIPAKHKILRYISGIFAGVVVTAMSIVSVSAYGYNSNMLTNPQPSGSLSGWSVSDGKLYDGTYGSEIKANGGQGPVTASQTVNLSANDKIRANNGELQVSASGYFWAQSTSRMTASVTVYAIKSNGSKSTVTTGSFDKKETWTYHNRQISASKATVPADTVSLQIYVSNKDNLAGTPPSMRQFYMAIDDVSAPKFVSGASKTAAGKYKKGTVISYTLRFSEPVIVSNSGTLTFSVGGQNVNAVYSGQSSNKLELNYNLTLPTTTTRGNNLSVTPKSVSGLVVKDDEGNSTTVSTTSSLNSAAIYLDNKEPEIISMGTAASSNAIYKVGETISFTATFDEYIKVTGSPVITLSNGKTAVYKKPATSTDTVAAEFVYTVEAGDNIKPLNITAVKLNGITDNIGNTATSAPGYSQTKHNAFLENYNISVDTDGPVVTFPEISEWIKSYDEPIVITDDISAVSEVYALYSELFSVTPSPENVIPETYVVPCPRETGEYYLVIKAVDSIGNVSVSYSENKYKFDFTNPEITPEYIFVETDENDLVTDVNVTATDEHSGIASVQYRWLDENGVIVLSGDDAENISIPDKDGEYSIEIIATDKTGNSTTVRKDGLFVDATAPVADFHGIEAVYKQSHDIDINVYDEKCGVVRYSYILCDESIAPSADDERWTETEETSFTTPKNTEGVYYLHIKAVDECGNEGVSTSAPILVDNLAPSISILPNDNAGNIGKAKYTVAVNVTDGASIYSELSVEYAVTESEEFPEDGFAKVVDGSVTVELSGKDLYLHIKATDKTENESVYTSGLFAADVVSPEGTIEKKQDKYYINVNTVSLMFTADDDYCDDIEMQIKVDEEELEWEKLADEKAVSFEEIEGVHEIWVRFRDEAGNVSEYTEPVEYFYDVTAPVISLSYSETDPTNKDVTVTATAEDEASDAEFTSAFEKTFSANGEVEFSAKDEAGNIAKVIATVDNIDKTVPEVTFESDCFDGKNYRSAKINIITEDLNGIASMEYCLNDSGEYETVSGNSVTVSGLDATVFITVRVTDGVGNVTTKKSPNVKLDNTAPVGTVTYTPATRTAQNVEAIITFNEEVTITNNDGNTYIFTDNGEFTFEFSDEAGNTAKKTAAVSWIDRTKPVARIALYDEEGNNVDVSTWVNYDLRAILVPPAMTRIENVYFNGVDVNDADGIEVIKENSEFIISENGTLSYTIIDTETFVEGAGETYIRIDKEKPVVSAEDVLYSETSWTNKDVTVRITAKDNLSGVEYINGNTYTFSENGEFVFEFTDEAGNKNSYTVSAENIDKSVPEAFITYFTGDDEFDNNSFTNKDVTAVIAFEDDGLSPVFITNNNGKDSVIFTDNGSFEFEFTDEAGNTGKLTASTVMIDKTAPTGYVVYSTSGWTNKDVTATLVATDDNGEIIVTNNDTNKYIFTENGEFTFEFCDLAGNMASVTASYDRIDKDAPVLDYTLSINQTTAFAVYAYVEANESVTYINNGGSPTIRFNSNGSYTIKAVDRAGNTSELDVVVSNISKETTPVYIEYSETELTVKDVYATIKPQNPEDVIYVTNNDLSKTYKFTENGEFVFTYRNAAGITGEAFASVINIDKTAPEVSVSYSHDSVTNEDVVVTFICEEEVIYPYYAQGGKFTFTENAAYSIPVSDFAGNVTYVTVETDLIDKVAPEITIPAKYKALKIGEEFDPLYGVSVTDNVTETMEITVSGEYDTSVPGCYTITYSAFDEAGNITSKTATVSVYDPNVFNVIVNDIVVTGDTVTVDSKDVKIEVISSEGAVSIKSEDGKRKTGVFKKNHNYISFEENFGKNGIYTIYIQDAERNSKLFWLYVIEEN